MITSTAWSPDGKKLASGSLDKSVRVWDTITGKSLLTLTGHESPVTDVFWNRDGSNLISIDVGGDGPTENFRVWDAQTGKLLDSHYEPSISQVISNSDGTKLAVLHFQWAGVEIRDGAKFGAIGGIGYDAAQSDEGHAILSADWSPDSQRIATGTNNGNIRIWDVATTKVLIDIPPIVDAQNLAHPVTSLHFNADGSKLFTIRDGKLQVWDATNGKLLVANPLLADLTGVGWSPFGDRLAQVGTSSSGHVVKSTVPLPSIDEAQALSNRCAKSDVQPQLAAKLSAKQLPAFITQVKQLTKDQMPPACAAALIAVATALQSTP